MNGNPGSPAVATGLQIANVPFDHVKPRAHLDRTAQHPAEIRPVSRGKVVEAHHRLAERKEIFEQARPNKSGDAGYDPDFGRSGERSNYLAVRCGDHELTFQG